MSSGQHDEAPGRVGAAAHHAVDDHGGDDGHDDHGHEEALGPIDGAAWGAGLLGVLIGLAVAFCFVLATSAPA
jgi:hypothetical protein